MERSEKRTALWRYGAFAAAYLVIAGLTVFGGSHWKGGVEPAVVTAER